MGLSCLLDDGSDELLMDSDDPTVVAGRYGADSSSAERISAACP